MMNLEYFEDIVEETDKKPNLVLDKQENDVIPIENDGTTNSISDSSSDDNEVRTNLCF